MLTLLLLLLLLVAVAVVEVAGFLMLLFIDSCLSTRHVSSEFNGVEAAGH